MAATSKVLLAHPDLEAGRSLASAFRKGGLATVLATDAVSTVNSARKERPNVIVLMGTLPGGGSASALERIRVNVHTTTIPVIAVTAAGAERQRLLACGAQECHDSIDEDALIASILRHVNAPLSVVEAPSQVIRDPKRLAALRDTGLLESKSDDTLDGLTRLATELLQVPTALLSLVDADRQVFKSQVGLAEQWARAGETPLSHSFCQWVVATEENLSVSDAREHPALCNNEAVRDLGVVAYAGMPMVTATGEAIGSFCAIDSVPRRWSDQELGTLRDLSDVVEAHIVLNEGAASPASSAAPRKRMQIIIDGIRGATRLLHRGGPRLQERARTDLLVLLDRKSGALSKMVAALN